MNRTTNAAAQQPYLEGNSSSYVNATVEWGLPSQVGALLVWKAAVVQQGGREGGREGAALPLLPYLQMTQSWALALMCRAALVFALFR